MKNTCKLIAVLLTLVLALAMTVPAFAAVTSSEVTCDAGETVTVEFKYEDIKAIGGTIIFSNEALFTEVVLEGSGFVGGDAVYNKATNRVAGYSTEVSDPVIALKLTVSAEAKPGDTCEVTFEYEVSADGHFSSEPVFVTDTVTVKVKGEAPVVIDYTELKNQIARADALVEAKYTPDSWAKMKVAYEAAKAALNSQSQEEVNVAAAALKKAIDELVPITDDPNPPTNDNNSFMVWTIAIVSGVSLAGAVVCMKKKTTK